ncbi:MAG: sigma-70 family RNA polymerase sigma factor [Planctomycetota bacterium]|nr:MAG: sigma-70 family RNA polymerase sigma factor [Planctomycetota bacterium]REJ97716.1 MAG: sigma-70 family RNA polymerase sigma factor [Planctomycetota bacterium]REK26670.1 MAG: sigma-70 family RNA polymerase sigma factor [Planctomycetota bacterium]REK35671.1 MAG: sigma-70 family RNA polymerase sigma factor [Planctomycetota bacterium]
MPTSEESSSTSISLIERARDSDPEAWRRLCLVYGPLVYRWARVVGLQDSDAADLGQEVFRTVAARLASFEKDRPGSTFRGWLKKITRNKIGDHLRRRERHAQPVGGTTAVGLWQQIPEDLPDASTSDGPFDAERVTLHRLLETIRLEFEQSTWRAFWLTTVEDRPTDEVAEELGLTRPAVRQAKYRVLRRLRTEIGSHDGSGNSV